METRKRSIAKAISWRLVASCITILIVWAGTNHLTLSLGIGLADFILKVIVYYLHERGWSLVKWGITI